MSDQGFCTSCGAPIQSTAEFCTGCGKSLKAKSKHKPFYKYWWFYVIVAGLIGFGIIGANSGGGNQSAASNDNSSSDSATVSAPATTSTQPTTTPAPAPAPKANKVGDTVTVGKFAVKVEGVTKTAQVGDDFLNKTAQGQYWILKVDVKNNDSSARVVDESMFKLVDSSGTTYDPDSQADIYANNNDNFFLNNVNPHLDATGFIVFDMPKDAKNLTLKVDSGVMFADTGSVNIDLGQ